jgi:hypothetical protein
MKTSWKAKIWTKTRRKRKLLYSRSPIKRTPSGPHQCVRNSKHKQDVTPQLIGTVETKVNVSTMWNLLRVHVSRRQFLLQLLERQIKEREFVLRD